jgi:hypothetical protein
MLGHDVGLDRPLARPGIAGAAGTDHDEPVDVALFTGVHRSLSAPEVDQDRLVPAGGAARPGREHDRVRPVEDRRECSLQIPKPRLGPTVANRLELVLGADDANGIMASVVETGKTSVVETGKTGVVATPK